MQYLLTRIFPWELKSKIFGANGLDPLDYGLTLKAVELVGTDFSQPK